MKIARKLKLAKAIADRSALSACMHTGLITQNLPNLLSLSAEIHEVPVFWLTDEEEIIDHRVQARKLIQREY